MTAPLHERLAEAAKAAGGERWIAAKYGPKTIGVGAPGGPAYMLVRPNHGDMEHLWPLIDHMRAADPESVAKLCEQVRVAEKAIADLLNCMTLAGWEGDFSAEQGREAIKQIRGEQ